MEDKWFIYFDDCWLRFHRSWTGAFIYAVRLEHAGDGIRATESWVNRNSDQYRWSSIEYDRESVGYMIDRFLLKKDRKPPVIPREYRVHVPLNGMALPASAARVNVDIDFSLLVGTREAYGNIVGRLVLPDIPSVGEVISLVGRQKIPASIPNFPSHLKVESILPVMQASGEGVMLMLEDVVLATAHEAEVVAKYYKDGLGLDCNRY